MGNKEEYVINANIHRKNNGFPFLDILGYLKNTHKNPKFGKVRQVPTREFSTKSLVGTCLTLPNLGFLWVFFKYPKIFKNGNPLFFPVIMNNAQSIPSVPFPHPRAFVILSVPAVGDLSENLCPRVGHLSILPEVVYILPFSIFHLKICLFR